MALEGQPVPDKFFEKGMQMLVDGADEQKLIKQMNSEIASMKGRHAETTGCITSWVDIAPAMGMIGTLIGLVQMLSAMDDPKAIGPAMAVALLTTLYGAMMANMVAKPIADKLNLRKSEESRVRAMCVDGVLAIQEGQNPRIIESILNAYLDPKKRQTDQEEE